MSINRVCISGNLTRDPELRSTAGGTEVLQFGVAVNERVKNPQTGEWEDRPNFVDCVMFGKRADSLSKLLAKGSKVAIDGRLRYSSWEKDGQRRSKLEVVAEEVELMSRQEQPAQPQYQPMPQQMPQQPQYQQYQAQPMPQYQQPQYPNYDKPLSF